MPFRFLQHSDPAGHMHQRLRPIVMSALAALLTLMPLALALAIGERADMQQPLVIAIVAGLILEVPLVLVVLPALLQLVATGRAGFRAEGG